MSDCYRMVSSVACARARVHYSPAVSFWPHQVQL